MSTIAYSWTGHVFKLVDWPTYNTCTAQLAFITLRFGSVALHLTYYFTVLNTQSTEQPDIDVALCASDMGYSVYNECESISRILNTVSERNNDVYYFAFCS